MPQLKPAPKKRKKKRRPSKRRGAGPSFERTICKRLSLWYTNGQRDDLFWRTALSGGRATMRFRKGKTNLSQVGDIGAIDSVGEPLLRKFVIECKSYGNLDIALSVLRSRGKLHRFWGEAVAEARTVQREPVLIAHETITGVLMLMTDSGAKLWGMEIDAPAQLLWGDEYVHIYMFDDVVPTLKAWKE